MTQTAEEVVNILNEIECPNHIKAHVAENLTLADHYGLDEEELEEMLRDKIDEYLDNKQVSQDDRREELG